MKVADLVVLVLCLVMAGGAFGAFYWWQSQEAQAAEQRYEAGVDRIIDNKINTVRLDFLAPQLASSSDRLAALQSLYADPDRSDHLNLGFGTLQGDFYTTYANYAEEAGRDAERDRFQREVDERWGEGAFSLMSAQYEAFLADAPRRQAEADAQMLEQCLAVARSASARRYCQDGYARARAAVAATP
jgi:hypothetical protein